VKTATVGVVASYPERLPERPFTIIGSGFCIRQEGVVVTCKHVVDYFVGAQPGPTERGQIKLQAVPQVMFYGGVYGTQIEMHAVSVINIGVENGFDLAVLKLASHPAFPNGFPTLPIQEYEELQEMMEIATCGYPLGDYMHDALGTITSSFTKGVISAINPAQGIACEHLRGFQLNLTATNGNSGGPVFSVSTGHVFGVLQGGVFHPDSEIVLQGIVKAEPVYPVLSSGIIDKLLKGPPPFRR
jgi:S1-C subfamily serine protease